MKYVFLLSKENIQLAQAEIESLIGSKDYKKVDNVLIVEGINKIKELLSKRLALTKKIFKLVFMTTSSKLLNVMQRFDWNKIYKDDFLVRIENEQDKSKVNFSERELAGYIWRKVKQPKVNLKNARTKICFIFVKDKVICATLDHEITSDFNARKAHNRPKNHPTSLNPKLARALINVTGVKKGEVVDAFCGTGGILIEAGSMDLIPTGYDINEEMLKNAKNNLEYYSIEKYKLEKKDALKINRKIKYLVSDLPYGRNTRQKDLKELYVGFIEHLRIILKRRAVVIFPLFNAKNIRYASMLRKNEFKIVYNFRYYIHKSLSKDIFVIENKK